MLWLITGSATPNQPAALKQCYNKAGGGDSALLTGTTDHFPSHPEQKMEEQNHMFDCRVQCAIGTGNGELL